MRDGRMSEMHDAVSCRVLLGAAAMALWITVALPWVTSSGKTERDLAGTHSGWGLLLAGLKETFGGTDGAMAFVIAVMPPLALLAATTAGAVAVATTRRRAIRLAFGASIVAGLGVLGLYLVGAISAGRGPVTWSFEPGLFAALGLCAISAVLAHRWRELG